MGHGKGIKWYRHIELPGYGIDAATACLQVDPVRPPGTSYEFFGAANGLAQRAQALRDVLANLASIAATEGVWTGEAANSFRTILKDAQHSHYDQVPVRYDGYARALRQYGSALDGHQAAIDNARADVQAALDAYRRAQSFGPPKSPGAARCPVPSSPLPPGPSCVAVVDDCLAAARRFQVAYNDWVDAVTTCERAIERVDDDRLHNPHGMDAAGHEINVVVHAAVAATANLAGAVAGFAAALALLTLWCPPVAEFLLTVSTAAAMVKLAADETRREAWHENISLTDLAFDALGTIPVTAPTLEAFGAGRALKAGGLLAKLRAGAGAFGRTFGEEFGVAARGLEKVRWRPVVNGLGRAAAAEWDVLANAPSVVRETYDNRKQGWGRALEKGTLSVVLGPLEPVVDGGVRTVDKQLVPIRGPRLPFGR